MIRNVTIEPIKDEATILEATQITQAELKEALDTCIKQIDANMEYFQDKFPYSATKDQVYPIIENIEWTDGFWSGMLWLAYEYTKDEKYRTLATKHVDSFYHRIENRIELDHHDLGFLYSLSCVSAYKLTQDPKARKAALMAADKLCERWQEKGQFLQAWGPLDSKEHYRFIIDCMLNIPLLYWASEESKDPSYFNKAKAHFETSCRYVIRDDASSFHTFYMDPETGGPDHGATRQGYNDESAWARGQAWGIYGIPLNMRYTKESDAKSIWLGMMNYFLNRLPNDHVCYWDLIFNDQDDQPRDSSAAAIAVCGILEMMPWLNEAEANLYGKSGDLMLRSLMEHYVNKQAKPGQPILEHGVYSWHSGKGVDEGNIWGDYYYMEALMRKWKEWNPYW